MKKYLSTFGGYSALQGCTLFLGALWPFLVAAQIPAADFGNLSIILAVFLGIQTVVMGSLTTPTILYRYKNAVVLKNLTIIGMSVSAVVVTGSVIYSYSLPHDDYLLTTALITCGISYMLRSLGQTLCIATQNAHITALCEGIATLMSIYIIITSTSLTLPTLLLSQVPYGFFGAIATYYGIRTLSQPSDAIAPQHSYWQLYRWQLIGLTASYVVSWGVVVLTSPLLTKSELGSLALSLKFQGGIASLLFLMTTFYTPRLLNKEAREVYTAKNTKVLSFLLGAVILLGGIGTIGSYMLYETTYEGSTGLVMLGTVALIPLIYTARTLPLLNANNQSITVQKNAVLSALLTISGALVLTPVYGAAGVVVSIGLGYALQGYLSWRVIRS